MATHVQGRAGQTINFKGTLLYNGFEVGSKTISDNFKIGDPDAPENGSTVYSLPDEFEGQAIDIFSSDLGRFLIAGQDYTRNGMASQGLELTLLNGNQFLTGGYWNISGGKAIDGAQEVLDEAKAYTDDKFDEAAQGISLAYSTTNPTTTPLVTAFRAASGATTYTNFLSAASTPIVVSSTDLGISGGIESNEVFFYKKPDGFWEKKTKKIADTSQFVTVDELGTVYHSDSAFVGGKNAAYVFVDNEDNVLFCIYEDQSTSADADIEVAVSNGLTVDKVSGKTVFKYGEVEGQIPFGSDTEIITGDYYHNGKAVLFAFVDDTLDGVFVIYKDGSNNLNLESVAALEDEVASARGEQNSLSKRLSGVISVQGFPTTPIWGAERLRTFNWWKSIAGARYDLVCIGDSYTEGNYWCDRLLTSMLVDGYVYGGAGFCGFGRFSTTDSSAQKSIRPAEFTVNYDATKWAANMTTSDGICGSVSSSASTDTITLTVANEPLNSIEILYKTKAGGAGFNYRVNAGANVSISTNAAESVLSTIVNVTSQSLPFTITIEALGSEVELLGAIGRKSGNTLQVHKCGISGGRASMFGITNYWTQSVAKLTPTGAMLMFGTNEQVSGISPATFKINLQNIVTKLRSINPLCDIITACPTESKGESETPGLYRMREYAQVLFDVAQENNGAFINLSNVFGEFGQYQIDAGLMHSDRVHPQVPRGGQLISNTFFKIFKK